MYTAKSLPSELGGAGLGELLLELIEGAEGGVNGLLQGTGGLACNPVQHSDHVPEQACLQMIDMWYLGEMQESNAPPPLGLMDSQ